MQKTKTLSQLKKQIEQAKGETGTTAYRPKGGDEQRFFDMHKIEVIDDANGNDDAIFKGMSVKPVNRKEERHGYDDEEAKKAYDARIGMKAGVSEEYKHLEEGEEAHAQFQKYHNDTATLLKKIHQGLSKHYTNVTSKNSYNNGVAHWGHVGDIKHIHRQLQDIHDSILQQGEYAKPQKITKLGEDTELDERTLTTGEMKKREDVVKGMKKNLKGFKSRYGEDAKSVMYATATKLAKEEVEEDLDVSLLELFVTLDDEEKEIMQEMIANGIDKEIFEEVAGENNNG